MTESFTAASPMGSKGSRSHRKVLVTGAAGRIGSYFAKHSFKRYDLRLHDLPGAEGLDELGQYGEVVTGELGDLDFLKGACEGIDTVVHLAANPSPHATWDSVMEDNIRGTYHVFVAAKAAGCRRVVYASSIHAISGYPVDVQVKTNDPVNPGDLYGVSKCFGEAMARYMAEQEGVSAVAIRIGAFQPESKAEEESSLHMMDAWVSHRDLNQLIQKCIDADHVKFAIAHGLSDNRFKRMDLSDTKTLLGYEPQDDLTEENPRLKKLHLNEQVGSHAGAEEKSGLRKEL